MQIPSQILLLVEIGLQRLLEQSPESQITWAAYTNKIAHVQLTELGMTIGIAIGHSGKTVQIFDAQRTTLRAATDAKPEFDLRLTGSLPALLRVWAGAPPSAAAVTVTGDVGFAQHLMRALGQLDIDWFALFTPHIGAFAGAKIGNFLKNTLQFGKNIMHNAPRDGLNYVRDEARLLAHRAEFEVWQNDVQALHARVERLAARIAHAQK